MSDRPLYLVVLTDAHGRPTSGLTPVPLEFLANCVIAGHMSTKQAAATKVFATTPLEFTRADLERTILAERALIKEAEDAERTA